MYVALILNRKKVIFAGILILVITLMLGYSFYSTPFGFMETVTDDEEEEEEDRKVPIYYVETSQKQVAFSFDASWGAEKTPRLLDILEKYDLKTTFFITGHWIEEYPDWVEKIAEAGHELGNHTATHPHMTQLTENEIRQEVQKVEDSIYNLTGEKTTLFRPPFGDYNNLVITTLEEMGYQVIQWSIDSLDWKNLNKEALVERVTGRSHQGAIILFHNDGLYTPDALPEIIAYYQENGYEILPISELVYGEDYEIDPHTGAQRPTR